MKGLKNRSLVQKNINGKLIMTKCAIYQTKGKTTLNLKSF